MQAGGKRAVVVNSNTVKDIHGLVHTLVIRECDSASANEEGGVILKGDFSLDVHVLAVFGGRRSSRDGRARRTFDNENSAGGGRLKVLVAQVIHGQLLGTEIQGEINIGDACMHGGGGNDATEVNNVDSPGIGDAAGGADGNSDRGTTRGRYRYRGRRAS